MAIILTSKTRQRYKRPPRWPFTVDHATCEQYGLTWGIGVLSGVTQTYSPYVAQINDSTWNTVTDTRMRPVGFGWGCQLDTSSLLSIRRNGGEDDIPKATESMPSMASATDYAIKTMIHRANWVDGWANWESWSALSLCYASSSDTHFGCAMKLSSSAPRIGHDNGNQGPLPPGGDDAWLLKSSAMSDVSVIASREFSTTHQGWFWSDYAEGHPGYVGTATSSSSPGTHASTWNIRVNGNRTGGFSASQEWVDTWLGDRVLTVDEGVALLERDRWAMYEEYGRTSYHIAEVAAPPAGDVPPLAYHHRHHNLAG